MMSEETKIISNAYTEMQNAEKKWRTMSENKDKIKNPIIRLLYVGRVIRAYEEYDRLRKELYYGILGEDE